METLNEQVAQAHRLRETNQLQAAEALYKSILEQHPNQWQAITGLGHVYRQQGQPEQALAYFQQSVALNPNELWPNLALSEQLRDKREFTAALAILDTMEQLHSNRWEIFHHRGYIYRAQCQPEQALAYFQQAVALNPNGLWTNLALSEQLRDKGEFNSALAVLDTIEQHYPNNFEIWLRRGYVYRMQGNNEQTSDCFQTASNLNPNNIGIKLALIDELRQQGKLNQTYEILNDGLLKEPTNPHLLLRHALIHRELGQRAQALLILKQSTNIHPNDFKLHLELANELRDQNKLEQSLAEFNFLQQNFPPHFQVLFHLAHLYRRQGNYSQAVAYFQKAIAIEPNNIHGHIAIVEVLRESQQFTAAWEKLTTIEQLYPQRFETLYQKGLLYRIQNNSNQAIACFQQVLIFSPNNFWGQIQLSEELRNQGQFASALTILDTLDTKQPNNFHVLMYKGHLYQAQNDNAQALLYFQKAYELDNSSTNALLQIANEQFKLGAIDEAMSTLIQNLTKQPSDLYTLLQIGNWLNIANAKEQALKFFQKAREFHPNQISPYLVVPYTDLTHFTFLKKLL